MRPYDTQSHRGSRFGIVLRGSAVFCTVALFVTLQAAAAYPDRPLRYIVPQAAGSASDTSARIVAFELTRILGQQVVVDNRPGGGLTIGIDMVVRAAPDGYTIGYGNIGGLAINRSILPKVPYDALTDFAPISLLASTPSFVSVHPSVPARNVKELIALAKARPGTLNYGGAGTGTNPHIAGELFNYLAKTEIAVVQYKGGGPALTAAISGEVGVSFSGIAGATGFVKSGRLRALGVTSVKESPALPGVPPIASVLPGYEFSAWFALVAPKGTPREIITVLNQHFTKAIASPELARRFADEGIDAIGSTPEQLGTFIDGELKKFARVIKERKMKTD